MNIVVLGAGLAGLSAAEELTRQGHKVVVIEKEAYSGGLAATIQNDEFRYDLGPHRFHTSNEGLLKWVQDLPGIEMLELDRVSRIRLLDKYFDYPLALSNVVTTMPLHMGAGMMLSFMWEKIRSIFIKRDQNSFEGWVLSRFGSGLYNLYLAPYNKKLWGIEPSELSADWASQRITVPSLAGLIKETIILQQTIVMVVKVKELLLLTPLSKVDEDLMEKLQVPIVIHNCILLLSLKKLMRTLLNH